MKNGCISACLNNEREASTTYQDVVQLLRLALGYDQQPPKHLRWEGFLLQIVHLLRLQ